MLRVEADILRAVRGGDRDQVTLRGPRLHLPAVAPCKLSQLREIEPHLFRIGRERRKSLEAAERLPTLPIGSVRARSIFGNGSFRQLPGCLFHC
jgi:hypothetical protein